MNNLNIIAHLIKVFFFFLSVIDFAQQYNLGHSFQKGTSKKNPIKILNYKNNKATTFTTLCLLNE